MARLFYPILFCVTAALALALWSRHGLPAHWLRGLDVQQAQAQSPDPPPRGADRYAPAAAGSPSRVSQDAPAPGAYRNYRGAAESGGAFVRPGGPASSSKLRIPGPGAQGPASALPRPDQRPAGSAPVAFENAQVIARIGDQHILLADVINDVEKEFAAQSKKYHPRDHDKLRQLLIFQHIQQLIPTKAMVQAARREIDKEKLPEVQKQLDTMFDEKLLPILMKDAGVNSAEEFEAKLKADGSSLKRLKESMGEQQVAQTYIADHVKVDEQVSPDELFAYYREHYEEYQYEAKVRYEQLLVKFDGRTRQEAIKALADMGNQVRNGAAWAAVAKARSEGLTAIEGGLVDWTTKGSLKFKMLDEALFSLPLGAMSIILVDERSAQIVRVVERKDAGVISFQEAQAEIKKEIVKDRTHAQRTAFIRKKLEEMRPHIWTMFDHLTNDKNQQKGQPEAQAERPGPGQRLR